MPETASIRYFPGINGLRFIAALVVLTSHAYQTVVKIGLVPEITSTVIFDSGPAAVDFFFTLSGFLITYLLLAEHSATGTISLPGFYLRRVCRIWPLYFLVLAIGVFLLGIVYPRVYRESYFNFPLLKGVLFYIFFLPNLMFAYHKVGLLSPLWSIGIEEQFYLFWAPLVKFFRREILPLILGITAGVTAMQITVGDAFWSPDGRIKFLQTFRFHYMGVGALFAWLLFSHPSRLLHSWVTSTWLQALTLAALVYHFTCRLPFSNQGIADIPLSLCYAALIINVSVGPKRLLNLEWEPLGHLGRISYGIYMYHMIIDYGLRMVFQRLGWCTPSTLVGFAYGFILFSLTIAVAHVSYEHVERRLLKLAGRHP